jgi:MFS family permease
MPSFSSSRDRVLILLCLTQFMVIFDFASVTISTATIRDALHFSTSAAPWIYSAYGLTYGGFLLLGGRLADLYGRKRILTLGLWIFSIFSMVNFVSPDQLTFLGARALKGIGAALICPAALAELNVLFPQGRERHAALGVYGLFVSAGVSAGDIFGGIISGYSWRLTILLNAIIGALLVWQCHTILYGILRVSKKRTR